MADIIETGTQLSIVESIGKENYAKAAALMGALQGAAAGFVVASVINVADDFVCGMHGDEEKCNTVSFCDWDIESDTCVSVSTYEGYVNPVAWALGGGLIGGVLSGGGAYLFGFAAEVVNPMIEKGVSDMSNFIRGKI